MPPIIPATPNAYRLQADVSPQPELNPRDLPPPPFLDPGEDPIECAGRELAEETGWKPIEIHELGSFFTTPGFTDEVLHAYIATPLEPAPEVAQDPDEAIENVTMTVEEALDACRDGTIRDSKTLATLFLAQLHGWI